MKLDLSCRLFFYDSPRDCFAKGAGKGARRHEGRRAFYSAVDRIGSSTSGQSGYFAVHQLRQLGVVVGAAGRSSASRVAGVQELRGRFRGTAVAVLSGVWDASGGRGSRSGGGPAATTHLSSRSSTFFGGRAAIVLAAAFGGAATLGAAATGITLATLATFATGVGWRAGLAVTVRTAGTRGEASCEEQCRYRCKTLGLFSEGHVTSPRSSHSCRRERSWGRMQP